jgi:hypothetical protein
MTNNTQSDFAAIAEVVEHLEQLQERIDQLPLDGDDRQRARDGLAATSRTLAIAGDRLLAQGARQ